MRRGVPSLELEPTQEDDGAEQEIELMFRRKLMGLRRLPRYQRAATLRAMREWRRVALQALRERRARERHAKTCSGA